MRIIYHENKFKHLKLLVRDMTVLSVNQINIFQVLKCMHKGKHNSKPAIFDNTFTEIHHRYLPKIGKNNFKQPKIINKVTSFAIFSRGSKIWNNYLHEFEKTILSLNLFLNKLKNKQLESANDLAFH